MEAMLTIRPQRCFFIWGTAAAMPWNAADRLIPGSHPIWPAGILHRRGELDAGIVHQDVEASELLDCRGDQSAHGIGLRHVGAVVDRAHAVVAFDPLRMASISPGSPKPFNTRLAPSLAGSLAIPSPMPLVDPVTMATLSFNMGIPFEWSKFMRSGVGDMISGRRRHRAGRASSASWRRRVRRSARRPAGRTCR